MDRVRLVFPWLSLTRSVASGVCWASMILPCPWVCRAILVVLVPSTDWAAAILHSATGLNVLVPVMCWLMFNIILPWVCGAILVAILLSTAWTASILPCATRVRLMLSGTCWVIVLFILIVADRMRLHLRLRSHLQLHGSFLLQRGSSQELVTSHERRSCGQGHINSVQRLTGGNAQQTREGDNSNKCLHCPKETKLNQQLC